MKSGTVLAVFFCANIVYQHQRTGHVVFVLLQDVKGRLTPSCSSPNSNMPPVL